MVHSPFTLTPCPSRSTPEELPRKGTLSQGMARSGGGEESMKGGGVSLPPPFRISTPSPLTPTAEWRYTPRRGDQEGGVRRVGGGGTASVRPPGGRRRADPADRRRRPLADHLGKRRRRDSAAASPGHGARHRHGR